MSTLSRLAATSQTLSIHAMEEASREGLREADLEHLLLALVLNDQVAGQILRNQGLAVDTVRAAIEAQRSDQLRLLGVTAPATKPGPIVFHETGGYSWTSRAQDLFTQASRHGRSGDASAVLSELLQEPSGAIADIFERLDVSRTEVQTQLDAMAASDASAASAASFTRATGPGQVAGICEAFVPAPISEVWALLSDPTRMPEWDPAVGKVSRVADSNTWIAEARSTRPDGRKVRIKPQFVRREVTRRELQEPTLISWSICYPDAKSSNPHTLSVRLSPATGGTQIQVQFAWRRRGGWRGLLLGALRPIQRMLVWLSAMQVATSISRVFRR